MTIKGAFMLLPVALTMLASCGEKAPTTLKDAYADKFLIGAAISEKQIHSDDPKLHALIKNQFSTLVAENCMKMEEVQPEEGVFNFAAADSLVDLAERNGQVLTGHCLVWHSQAPKWFFHDAEGNEVSRDVLIERMKTHVQTVVKHFKGKVHGWDVVNEAILDDGRMRESYYYKIIGPEFIRMAFEFAHEADPDVELYYNDYSMDKPAKRDAVVQLVRDLKAQGVRIDGVGMQSHVAFDTPLDEYEKSIKAFAAEGMQVMVTELDLSVLPWPKGNFGAAVETNFDYKDEMNPYTEGLPEEKAAEQTKFFSDLFQIYLRNSDAITRVTFWGVSDGDSWKNDWPVKGRTDYPLAFDRNYDPKPFVGEIIKLATEAAE